MQDAPQEVPQGGMQAPQSAVAMKPHRGGAILALGIIGICTSCFILGIIAWVMGSGDLKEMDTGRRDREGYSLTKAGMICGIISVVLAILGMFWFIFVVGISGMLGAFGC